VVRKQQRRGALGDLGSSMGDHRVCVVEVTSDGDEVIDRRLGCW
jgi:hypothetical protein